MNEKQPAKKVTRATINRRQQIKDEIYTILHTETHKWLNFLQTRENNVASRLSAIESVGTPQNTLAEINRNLSSLLYNQSKLIKATEELLSFFRITKDFFKEETN